MKNPKTRVFWLQITASNDSKINNPKVESIYVELHRNSGCKKGNSTRTQTAVGDPE